MEVLDLYLNKKFCLWLGSGNQKAHKGALDSHWASTHLSAQSLHTILSLGLVQTVTRADTNLLSHIVPPLLSGEQKHKTTNQLDDSGLITTVTGKGLIVPWCFRPNQLLTGTMWSARGVHRLNTALHKAVLFQCCLSARCSQPHIALDRHTGVNGRSCWANSETYCHSVRLRSFFFFAFDNRCSNLSSFRATSLTFSVAASLSKPLGKSRRRELGRAVNFRIGKCAELRGGSRRSGQLTGARRWNKLSTPESDD